MDDDEENESDEIEETNDGACDTHETCSNSNSPDNSNSNPEHRTGWRVVPNCLKQVVLVLLSLALLARLPRGHR